MTAWLAGWRVALRIARREALRHRGRSLLVLAMVALPILGLTAADVLARTMQLSPAERTTRDIGAADAQLIPNAPTATAATTYLTASQLAATLAPGSTVVALQQGAVQYGAHDGITAATVIETDLRSPLLQGFFRARGGRPPVNDSEVALSTALASALHLHVGDRWTLADPDRTVTVAALVVSPNQTPDQFLVALPGALLPAAINSAASSYVAQAFGSPTYLIRKPAGETDADLHKRTDSKGTLTTREQFLHPPKNGSGNTLRTQTFAVGIVGVGLGVLQVILLAGAAFAVGARRQMRDLALLSASGGERRHVRAVVLANGVVLGAVAGVVGIALGVPLGALLEPVIEHRSGTLAGSFDLRPAEIALGAVIGTVAAVLAALVPARAAARQDVVSALAGRRGIRGTPARITLGGVAAIIVGALVTARGAHSPANPQLVLAGAAIAELGFVACAPALIGLAARGARFLPLAGRMALRDAARNRARSGPAVAAVMAALAGAVAVSTYTVSSSAHDHSIYQGEARVGQATFALNQKDSPELTADVTRAAALLPTRDVVPLSDAYRTCTPQPGDVPAGEDLITACPDVEEIAPPRYRCPTDDNPSPSPAAFAAAHHDPRCDSRTTTVSGVAVGGADLMRALLGRTDPAIAKALSAGKAIALAPHNVDGGLAYLQWYPQTSGDATPSPKQTAVPAIYLDPHLKNLPYSYPTMVISPATAARLGYVSSARTLLVDTYRAPTKAEEARANAQLKHDRADAQLSVERGFSSTANVVQLSLTGVAALVTIGAVAIATGLAAAEGKADLATLAAVGASPGVRRRLAMAQASVIALLGAGLGVVSGLIPAIAVVHARSGWPLTFPWTAIGVAVVAVPLLAAGLAGVVTRSRLPMVARLT